VMHAKRPSYIRAERATEGQDLLMRWTFSISTHLIDNVFLTRVKELAINDQHLGEHIKASIAELEVRHNESVISVDEHLAHVRTEIEKTMALLHDNILNLTSQDKQRYNGILEGLRAREADLVAIQENSPYESLQETGEKAHDFVRGMTRPTVR
jgi:hypothetical protein